MPLNQALDSNNAEMTKRLKYTKDILTHMLNNNQQNPVAAAGMNRQQTAGSTESTTGLSSQGQLQLNSNSSRRGAPMNIGGGMPGVNSAISQGGISAQDLPMNGFNLAGVPGGNTISNTNSNSGGV